jgi:diadenosine tetraphosphate (Ap4A) HIT family hydrolase
MKKDKSKCVFCQEVDVQQRKLHPRWIADLQVSTAFLCKNQVCRGYTILTYNQGHYTELFQLEKADLIAYSQDLAKIAKAIYQAYHPLKVNYELLGNVVPHLHWHVIPRQKTDPVDPNWPIWGGDFKEVRLSDNEYSRIIEEIRRHLK